MKKFFYKVIAISLVLAILGAIVFVFVIPQYYLPVLPFLLLFFAVTTLLLHHYQLQLAKKSMARFTSSTMLISFLKLFLYSLVAVIYIIFDTENAKVFVACLMLFYIVFTTFETVEVLKITNRK